MFYCPSKTLDDGTYEHFYEPKTFTSLTQKCDYTSLNAYSLNFEMGQSDKLFWEHLFIISLAIKIYPKFKINIVPTKVVDYEVFEKDNFKPPAFFTFAKNDLNNFYKKNMLTKVCNFCLNSCTN